jgi:hypothetical protein
MLNKGNETARSLLDKSLEVLKREITKLLAFSENSEYVLDPESIKSLNDMTRTLVMMDKNSKTTPDDPDEDGALIERMSDDELMALAKEIVKEKEVPTKKKKAKK